MNTLEDAIHAIANTIADVFEGRQPAYDADTKVQTLDLPDDQHDGFARCVSDRLALLPNSEAELYCIILTENSRRAGDPRAMSMLELAERIARLPDYEG